MFWMRNKEKKFQYTLLSGGLPSSFVASQKHFLASRSKHALQIWQTLFRNSLEEKTTLAIKIIDVVRNYKYK